ncbi:tetraacyldisaccharide 4'-kinase [Abyssalbus ytuae]|uniref:Tetraacyldisaccharide 4'-kinase n=1 Tax=Abyssalbus ytuae TaxID=2926907 RepID=A0A9E6ZZQ9_9FLAO|nr:tetraacyldisaccharide 4'-kinase [Abyssalbus ytuae]UOB18142.1 tetraacyldisaccharide 4'-kinase [Abyssalbus ytuae]
MQVFRKLLLPFSLLYSIIIMLRNFFYDKGILNSTRYNFPVICVGNLSVGGTGKTPMTEFLISFLKDKYKLAVLSRGYKRKSKGFILADDHTTAEEIGDEPFQYFNKFKNIHVAVDANRHNGIYELKKLVNPDIIILDDAFQHRKVVAGFNILLTVYNDLYVDDFILPAGNLRDNIRQAKRADVIIVTKCPADFNEEGRKRILNKIKPKAHQKIFFSSIAYSDIISGSQGDIKIEKIKGEHFNLVTGIAKPAPLVNYLKQKGLDFTHYSYPDHHNFSVQEIEKLKKMKLIITTEKDYVRIANSIENMYYLGIKPEFLFNEEENFKKVISSFLNRY